MAMALRLILFAGGLACATIAASILVKGAQATALQSETLYAGATGAPLTPSELRFPAALLAAYGALLVWVAARLRAPLNGAPWLAAVVFLGGLGRIASIFALGRRRPVFEALAAVEPILPVVVLACWRAATQQQGKPA